MTKKGKYVFDSGDLPQVEPPVNSPTDQPKEKGEVSIDDILNRKIKGIKLGKDRPKQKATELESSSAETEDQNISPPKAKQTFSDEEVQIKESTPTEPAIEDLTEVETADDYSLPQLDLSRTLTEDEYFDLLSELNEDAEDKNYVFVFGIPGSGKSFIIASLLKYMEQCDLGQSRLDVDQSTETEKRLYNRMIMSFSNPKDYRIESNATLDFNRFNIIFTPKGNKPEKTITFLDVSGEACQAIYQGDSSKYTGELPDFLRVVLESDINSTFLLVGELEDEDKKGNQPPQDRILKAFYDKILDIQDKEGKQYHKILLISKWDNIAKNRRDEVSVVDYAKKHLPVTMNNFLAENHKGKVVNAITHYSVGEFKGDRLIKFNEERPAVLFNSLYECFTGQPLKNPEPFYKKAFRYLMGH